MLMRLFCVILFISFAYGGDVSVVITEKTLNDFISEVGPISGKGKSKGVGYTWKVKKASFNLEPNAATFNASVDLNAGVFKMSDKVKSKVNVSYNAQQNKITMEVDQAIFKIYIKVFGKKVKVGQVDIAKYYKPKFAFNGPQPIQNMIEMEVGKNRTRQISVTMTGHELLVQKDQVTVSANLKYQGQNKK